MEKGKRSMLKKIWDVIKIVVAVGGAMLLVTMVMPVVRTFSNITASDPSAGNYVGLTSAANAAPWWLYFSILIVGGIAVVIVLRRPEK